MTRAEALRISKPILFNTQMVRAILYGEKTVTRRIIKPQPPSSDWKPDVIIGNTFGFYIPKCAYREHKLPYKIGNILYVREAFNNEETNSVLYRADDDFISFGIKLVDNYYFRESEIKWKPSIHMPKEAARIFLKVTNVRVERLQDITPEQAFNEGVGNLFMDNIAFSDIDYGTEIDSEYDLAKEQFAHLWDSTVKKTTLDQYSWKANPWVWVIEFERMKLDDY